MERITSGSGGYYVAAYAFEVDGAYQGYAKVCAAEPSCVWQCRPLTKVAGAAADDIEAALQAAETKGRHAIDLLMAFGSGAFAFVRPTTSAFRAPVDAVVSAPVDLAI